MTDTFMFKGIMGIYEPKDREYYCQNGEYVRLPNGNMYLIEITDRIDLIPVEASAVPANAVIIDLVRVKLNQ